MFSKKLKCGFRGSSAVSSWSVSRSRASPWRVVGSNYVLETPWIKVRRDELELRDGSKFDYYVSERKNFCVAVCLTSKNEVVLLKHFRHPAGGFVYELPAGLVEDGEKPREAMERELLEETGFKAGLKLVGKVVRDPSSDVSKGFFFLGRNAVFKRKPVLEKLEEITVELRPWREALRLATESEFRHPLTIAALYWCLDKAGLLR